MKRSAPRFAELAAAPDELTPASLGLRNREEACFSATSPLTASAVPPPPLKPGEQLGQRAGHSVSAGRMTSLQWLTAPRRQAALRPAPSEPPREWPDGRRRVVGCKSRDDSRPSPEACGSTPHHSSVRLWPRRSRAYPSSTDDSRGQVGSRDGHGTRRGRAADVGGRQQRLCRRGSTGAGHGRGPARVGSGAAETSSSSEGEPCSRKRNDWRSHSC